MVRITVPPSPSPLTPLTIIQEEEQAVENENEQPEMAVCREQEWSIREIKATTFWLAVVEVACRFRLRGTSCVV